MRPELTPEQQERHARHLLLDGWGGEGQELLLAATVALELPEGCERAAAACARYLAASGVGTLVLSGACADAAERALAAREAPDTRVLRGPAPPGALCVGPVGPAAVDLDLARDPWDGPAEGARLAAEAVRVLLCAIARLSSAP